MKNILLLPALLCCMAFPALAQKTAYKLVDVVMYSRDVPLYGGPHSAAGQTLTIDRETGELWLLSGMPGIANRLFRIIAIWQQPDTVQYVCKPITDGSPDTVFMTQVPAGKLLKLQAKNNKYPQSSKMRMEYHYQ